MKNRKGKHAGTDSRRKVIIRSALACFSEIGFSETSMADIREHSKASTGSIYHHFKSKEQLAARVYLEGIRSYQEGLIAALEGKTIAREGIYALIEQHLKWVQDNVEWSRYLFQKRHYTFMSDAEEEIADLNKELMRSTGNWFSHHIEKGTLRDLPGDISISIILGPCMEFTRQYLSGHTRTTMDQAVDHLCEAAWQALKTFAGGVCEDH
jgi:AcrR family transcriptional regulator